MSIMVARRWAAWKADGCKGFEREETGPLSVLPLSPQLKTAAPPVQNRVQTGSDALDRCAAVLTQCVDRLRSKGLLLAVTCHTEHPLQPYKQL